MTEAITRETKNAEEEADAEIQKQYEQIEEEKAHDFEAMKKRLKRRLRKVSYYEPLILEIGRVYKRVSIVGSTEYSGTSGEIRVKFLAEYEAKPYIIWGYADLVKCVDKLCDGLGEGRHKAFPLVVDIERLPNKGKAWKFRVTPTE